MIMINAIQGVKRVSKETGHSATEVSRAMNALATASNERTDQVTQVVDTKALLIKSSCKFKEVNCCFSIIVVTIDMFHV